MSESIEAANRPVISVRKKREVHSGDVEMPSIPSTSLDGSGILEARGEDIVLSGEESLNADYQAELAFNEEVLTIRLERSADKFAPQFIDVYCNGVAEWIPVGKPHKVKRKFVEVLALSKPDEIQTEVIERMNQDPQNLVHHSISCKYPFSVISDPNPNGSEWLTRLLNNR